MQFSVKGKNLDVSDGIRDYAERKFAKLTKLVPDLAPVELELSVEKNPSIATSQVAEATIWVKGQTVRGREATTDMKASIDELVNKLERQMKRYRERRRQRPQEDHPLARMPTEPAEPVQPAELAELAELE
jgi:putative sigma-54 modulation protein